MSSMDGLKRRIAAREYTVDAHEVAGAILEKLAIIKRTRRAMADAEEQGDTGAARGSKRRGTRAATPGKRGSRGRGQRSSQGNGR